MKPKATIEIVLSQSYLWDDKSDLAVWPRCLQAADPDAEYSYETLKESVFGMVVKNQAKTNRARDVRGPEIKDNVIHVRGVGLFEGRDSALALSDAGTRLRRTFLKSPDGEEWKIILGEQVLKFDVRTRAVLFFLGALGYGIVTGSSSSLTADPVLDTKLTDGATTFYLFEKTLRGHLSDLVDFGLCIKCCAERSGFCESVVERFLEMSWLMFDYCSSLFGSSPLDMAEESNLALIKFLSSVLVPAKAVLRFLELNVTEKERKKIRSLRLGFVPYYNSDAALGNHLRDLKNGLPVERVLDEMSSSMEDYLSCQELEQLNSDMDMNAVSVLRSARKKHLESSKGMVIHKMMEFHKHRIVGNEILKLVNADNTNEEQDITIRGLGQSYQREPPSSRNMVSIPMSLELFRSIGVLRYSEGLWKVDHSSLLRFDDALVKELAGSIKASEMGESMKASMLKQAFCASVKANGFAAARDIEKELSRRMGVNDAIADFVCKIISELEADGMIEVQYRSGLPMHGIGLCGDPSKRMMRIRFSSDTRR